MPRERSRREPAELFNRVIWAAVLVLSALVMAAGIAVAAGVISLRMVPEEFRAVMGIVVFLYGLYRFVLALLRSHGR